MKSEYASYEEALNKLNLQKLSERRITLATNFAKKCTKHNELQDMFPLNEKTDLNLRNTEKYKVKHARTARLYNSPIPVMQRLLNNLEE